MSARFFPKGLQDFVAGLLDWDAHDFKVALYKLDGTLTDTAIKAITGATNANPVVYTVGSTTGWNNGDIIVIRGIVGNLAANQTGRATIINGTTFSLTTLRGSLNVQGSGAYVSGGCAINLTIADRREDIDAAQVGGVSANLGSKTNVNGTIDAADPTGMTLNDTAHAMVIYRDAAGAANDQLLHFHDGKQIVTVAADAASSATTLWVEPLVGALDDNEVMVFSNGVTAQVNGAVAAGARSITVDALPGAIAAGHQADVRTTNSGFPISSAGGPVQPSFDAAGIGTI